jgi:hypothetical protein
LKTDELIRVLSTGIEEIKPAHNRRRSAVAAALGFAAALALSAGLLKLNPTLPRFAAFPMFWVREAFCLTLACAGTLIVSRLGRPGRILGLSPAFIAFPIAIMWILGTLALLDAEPLARLPLLLGHTARACPLLIALLALPPFAAFLWNLRRMAPTRPELAGAAYTLHCPEVAAPFIAVWYVLGMLIPTIAGAWCGPRLLRW